MSRNNMSEERRFELICNVDSQIDYLEAKKDHLMSDEWREAYPFKKQDFE